MKKTIQLDFRSRKKIRLLVFLGLRLHPKTPTPQPYWERFEGICNEMLSILNMKSNL